MGAADNCLDHMTLNLFTLIASMNKPLALADHFKAPHLIELFTSKIARSQATGKDGVRVARFQDDLKAEAALIEKKVQSGTYQFTTFKERLIFRGPVRPPRQISIPTVRDRLTLRAVCQALHTHEKATVGSAPHALVRSISQAIRDGDQKSRSFVRIDVQDFFPSVSHSILRRELNHFGFTGVIEDLAMSAVSTPTGDPEAVANRGIPQGLSVSGALAALFMLRFDNRRRSGVDKYFRYVDDILLICDTKIADDALNSVVRALKSRGLTAHPKGSKGKTEISPVASGIDYLGYHICIEKISVRESSYKRMFRNLQKVITDYRYRGGVEKLLFRINLKISGCIVDGRRRGWMMFFSHTENMQQLAHLDAFVRRQLKKRKLPEVEYAKIKKFVKSYHEIRYRLDTTNYIPNFDNYDNNQRAEVVAALSDRTLSEVLAMDAAIIDAQFSRMISREVHDLEQDVGNRS